MSKKEDIYLHASDLGEKFVENLDVLFIIIWEMQMLNLTERTLLLNSPHFSMMGVTLLSLETPVEIQSEINSLVDQCIIPKREFKRKTEIYFVELLRNYTRLRLMS